MIQKELIEFLELLKNNNNREWFAAHKDHFHLLQTQFKSFAKTIEEQLNQIDEIEKTHIFRIYKDVRFSKDKSPYKQNFGVSFSRKKPLLRGGYYLHIEPNHNFIACGFWAPSPEDLLRIRKEIEMNDTPLISLLNHSEFKNTFGQLEGDSLKKAPKGFDSLHPSIELIKKKQLIAVRKFSNEEIFAPNFAVQILAAYTCIRPFFDYMSDALCTNLNGEPLF